MTPRSSSTHRQPRRFDAVGDIRTQLARALVGRTVDLLANANTIAHGVVTGVLTDSGSAKLVVDGLPYDLSQLLTATPPALG